MVNTLVIADEVAADLTAETLRDLAPELVLSAGDLPWDYVEWIADTVRCPTLFVAGNHDPDGPGPCPGGVTDAEGRIVEAAGLRVAGLGGCVKYRAGPHQHTQREYAGRARKLLWKARFSGPLDVLLTHAPPFGLGDAEDPPHVGIDALHKVIARTEPTWHFHGHIHPFGRPMPDRVVGRTTIRNVIPWRVVEITPRGADNTADLAARLA
jgi:Icc-related predicted phosphoesterase